MINFNGVGDMGSRSQLRYEVEKQEDWRGITDSIPFLKFPATWEVKVIPPWAGAVGRFLVKLPGGAVKSIYLDWYDALGIYQEPYWEVHPVNGDIGRCPVADTKELLRLIKAKG